MKQLLKLLACRCSRRRILILVGVLLAVLLLAASNAHALDVYGNIGPAPLVPAGGIFERYVLGNYQLDEFFPAISVGVFSGINASGVAPMIAFFITQVVWLLTAFLAQATVTIFTFCFSLNLLGNGSASSGALAPVSQAIHDIYAHTFGTPWLVAAITLLGIWAMWRSLVQRRHSEAASTVAVSLAYCLLGLGIVIAPQATIGTASNLANEMSTSLLSLTSTGELTSQTNAKQTADNQLFSFLVLEPWTVLEFGGLDHCVTETGGKVSSVPVRPLGSNPAQEASLVAKLEAGTEVKAAGKTCINNENKYASHFLAFASGSKEREAEHEALEKGDDADLPAADPAKTNKSYPLGPADTPAAEAMGKGGQYQRLLLSLVILAGENGAFLLIGALSIGVILAAMMLLFNLLLAPFALILGVIPGRGHEYFRRWVSRLAGCLLRKVIYSLILALTLTTSHALASAASNLGWLLAFLLQAGFLWVVFLNRNRLTDDFTSATAGPKDQRSALARLQTLYYSTRLARSGLHGASPSGTPPAGRGQSAAAPSPTPEPPTADGEDGTPPPSSPPPSTPGTADGEDGTPPPSSPPPSTPGTGPETPTPTGGPDAPAPAGSETHTPPVEHHDSPAATRASAPSAETPGRAASEPPAPGAPGEHADEVQHASAGSGATPAAVDAAGEHAQRAGEPEAAAGEPHAAAPTRPRFAGELDDLDEPPREKPTAPPVHPASHNGSQPAREPYPAPAGDAPGVQPASAPASAEPASEQPAAPAGQQAEPAAQPLDPLGEPGGDLHGPADPEHDADSGVQPTGLAEPARVEPARVEPAPAEPAPVEPGEQL